MSEASLNSRRAEILEIYEVHISYIRHENDLIHQRAARFLGIQAALLAVVGLVLQKYLEIAGAGVERVLAAPTTPVYLFLAGISCVGMLSCRSAHKSLSAADQAQTHLDENYSKVDKGQLKEEAKRIGLPELRGGGNPTLGADGSKFLLWLPNGMIVFWIFVFSISIAAFYYSLSQTEIWIRSVKNAPDWLGIVLVSIGSSVFVTIVLATLILGREIRRRLSLLEPTVGSRAKTS